MRGLSDSQQSTLIGVIARTPVEQARRLVLEKIEASLPKTGKVTNAQLLESINSALASIPPGRWQADERGVRPEAADCLHMTLAEIAAAYQRILKPATWCWPPVSPRTEQELKAKADKLAAMTPEQRGAAYARTLYETEEDYQAAKAAEEKRRQAEETADATPWPLPSPPTTRTIRGEVVPEPLDNSDDAIMDKLRRAKAKAEPDDDDARRTREINRQLEKERLLRRRLQGKPKAFFR